MINLGLLIFGITQFGTGITAFVSSSKHYIIGIPTLKNELSIYRYLLSGLWIAISCIYVIGAFDSEFTKAAVYLAFINGFLEVIGYFLGSHKLVSKLFPFLGKLWIEIQIFLIGIIYY